MKLTMVQVRRASLQINESAPARNAFDKEPVLAPWAFNPHLASTVAREGDQQIWFIPPVMRIPVWQGLAVAQDLEGGEASLRRNLSHKSAHEASGERKIMSAAAHTTHSSMHVGTGTEQSSSTALNHTTADSFSREAVEQPHQIGSLNISASEALP